MTNVAENDQNLWVIPNPAPTTTNTTYWLEKLSWTKLYRVSYQNHFVIKYYARLSVRQWQATRAKL